MRNFVYIYFNIAQVPVVIARYVLQLDIFNISNTSGFLFGFYRTTLCVNAVFAVSWYPSVCLSVTLVHSLHAAEVIIKLLCGPGSPSF